MPSSRLYELLAEAEGQPSRAFRDLQAATNAGTSIVDSVKKGKEERFGRQTLADVFGAESAVAKRFPNIRLKDLERKGLGDLIKADMENAPSDVIVPQFDQNGKFTGAVSAGMHPKSTRVVNPPTINAFKGRELTLAEQKAGEEKRQNDIKTLENKIAAGLKRRENISLHGMVMPGMEQEDSILQKQIDGWSTEIDGLRNESGGGGRGEGSGRASVSSAPQSQPDLTPVDLRLPRGKTNFFPKAELAPRTSFGELEDTPTEPEPIPLPTPRPANRAPARQFQPPKWEAIPNDPKLKIENSKGRFFVDPKTNKWTNHETGEIILQ